MSPIERSGGAGGGTASPLTTKGDVYTFSTVNARLPVGSDTQVLTANSSATTGNDWEYPPGHEFDYVELTSSVAITATTAATAQAVIDGNAVTFDGATRVKLEAFAPVAGDPSTLPNLLIELYDGATDLGHMGQIDGGTAFFTTYYGARFLTPSNGSHTFHIKAWKASGSPSVQGGVGGSGAVYVPAWYRITKA